MQGYSEEKITTFLELAQEIGLTPAMRQLGYPKSWATASKWAEQRGVEITVDTLKQHAKEFDIYYNAKDKLLVCQEGLRRIYEELITETFITADDKKKLADATKRFIEAMQLVEGKATEIKQDNSANDNVFSELLKEFEKEETNKIES